jgi:hypothetical protein
MLLMINDFVQNLVQLSLIIHLCIHILGNHIHLVLLVQSVSKLNIIFVSAKQRVIMHTANQLTFGTYGPFYNLTMPFVICSKVEISLAFKYLSMASSSSASGCSGGKFSP